ncbi:hypothetical protein [Azospirillum sp. SYSU D00513]|uniref:hypothetical protein n=1 Tax=Azospirillum sp. SYSU D00513 TaxID=2812561 RepID=UPI001A975156|nr:hypothetical protein [Azospirillum sp. SYSU D00513]
MVKEVQVNANDVTFDRTLMDNVLHLKALLRGEEIGRGVFGVRDGALMAQDIFVEIQYRKHGVARRIYAEAEQHFGMQAVPSNLLTSDSAAYWKANNFSLPKGAMIRPYSYWQMSKEEQDEYEQTPGNHKDDLDDHYWSEQQRAYDEHIRDKK